MILLEKSNNKPKYIKKYKCPYCEKRLSRKELVYHVDRDHEDMIPEGFSATRIVFNTINKKDHGTCTICGGESAWNEDKGRYDRICEKPKCHEAYIKLTDTRNINKYGTSNLLTDKRFSEEQQKKMLANRRISGKYRWSDGTEKTYTGSYEMKCLKFMDTVLNCKSEDVVSPGPVMYYGLSGVQHMYISDIYYVPYNLLIEIKDGGSNPNTRDMKEYREKQLAKEKAIIEANKFNYLRLTDNNFAQLLEMFSILKFQLLENNDEIIIKINENMFPAIGAFMPPAGSNDVYVVNYHPKNNFIEDDIKRMAVTRDKDLNKLISTDEFGYLNPINFEELGEEYTVYKVNTVDALDRYKRILEDTKENKLVTNTYIFETMTGKPLLTESQLEVDESLTEMKIYNKELFDNITGVVENSLLDKVNFLSLLNLNINEHNLEVRENEEGYYLHNTKTNKSSKCFTEASELEDALLYKNLLE